MGVGRCGTKRTPRIFTEALRRSLRLARLKFESSSFGTHTHTHTHTKIRKMNNCFYSTKRIIVLWGLPLTHVSVLS